MNKHLRYAILVVCIGVLSVSIYKIASYVFDYQSAKKDYNQATSLFNLPELPVIAPEEEETNQEENLYESYFENCNLNALKKVNSEVLGWIVIPNTNISYPVARHNDNSYYLTHTYTKEYNHVGTPFLDYRNKTNFTDFNSIIYGHRMKNKTMFSALHQFLEKKTWEENPYILLYTESGISTYKIFAAFKGDPDGISYECNITSDKRKQSFIDYAIKCSEYDTGIKPTSEDTFLTLSTCIGTDHSYRMIVNAVKIK